MIVKFTHDRVIDYLLPGVPPTGRQVEIAAVVVVHFRDGKLASEHIYWDQASVLVQIGKLDPTGLPIPGVEVARKASDRSPPSNQLMAREWRGSEGKPI
jgi:carboxymethylenebutenolidase